jgi:hypothetical protein
MLTKIKVNKVLENLPDTFTIDELIDQLIFIEKVEEGNLQSEQGKIVSNEDVKKMIRKTSININTEDNNQKGGRL